MQLLPPRSQTQWALKFKKFPHTSHFYATLLCSQDIILPHFMPYSFYANKLLEQSLHTVNVVMNGKHVNALLLMIMALLSVLMEETFC